MSFNPAIPQATDLISNSQAQILANFGQINSQFGGSTPTTGGDHDGFYNGTGNGSGMHNQVTFKANEAAPSLTRNSVLGVASLYVNAGPSLSQLFYQNATQNFQLTGLPLVTTTPSATGNGVITPWGLILNFGRLSVDTVGTAVVWQSPYVNNIPFVQVSCISSSGTKTCTVNNITLSGATLYSSSNGTTVDFFAIGN